MLGSKLLGHLMFEVTRFDVNTNIGDQPADNKPQRLFFKNVDSSPNCFWVNFGISPSAS